MEIEMAHRLGRDEAKRRIEAGLPKLEQHIPGGGALTATWSRDYVLDMIVSAMGQKIESRVEVEDSLLKADVSVPVMLKLMSGPITDFIRTSMEKMLKDR